MKKIILTLSILFILLSFFTVKSYAEYNLQLSEKKSKVTDAEIELHKDIASDMISLGATATNWPVSNGIDVNEAISRARTYVKEYPDNQYAPQVQLYLAYIYGTTLKNYAQAIIECEKVIKDYPENDWYVSAAETQKQQFQNEQRKILSQQVNFIVKPSKEKYLTGEPFVGKLIINNNSTINTNIYEAHYYEKWMVNLYVYDNQGQYVVLDCFKYNLPAKMNGTLMLKPGESFEIDYKVEGCIQSNEPLELNEEYCSDEAYKPFPIGKYSLQAEFNFNAKEKYIEKIYNKNLPIGRWPSESIEVQVISFEETN